jgi:PAS domain S-box-containing protein
MEQGPEVLASGSAAEVPLKIMPRPSPAISINVLEHLYDAIMVTDLKGNVQQANHRAEELFGYPLVQILGLPLGQLVDGINDELLGLMHQQLQRGRFTVLEARCTRENGSLFPAEIAVSSLELGGSPGLCFSLRNITQRREMQNQLCMAQHALQQAACGLLMVDLDSKVHFVNPAFCRLWDVAQPTDVLGHSIDDLFGTAHADLLRHGLAGHGPWSGVLEFVRADGTALRIEATSAPNFDFANVFVGLVISFIGVPPAHA